MFKAFKPSGMEKIARAMGYSGNMQGFQDYLAQDPMRQQQMQTYQQKAMQMAKGGVVKMQQGGTPSQITTLIAGEEGGPPPDLGPGGIFGTPKTAAVGEDEPTPGGMDKMQQDSMIGQATTMALGEEDGTMGGGLIGTPKTMAVGEDEPGGIFGSNQIPPKFSATQAVGEQPGDMQPIAQPQTQLPQQPTDTYDDAYIQTLIDQLGTAKTPGFDAQDYVRIGNTVYPSSIEAGKYLGAGQTIYGGNTAGGTGGGAHDVHPYRRFLNFDFMQSEGIPFYVKPGASGQAAAMGLAQSVPELVVGGNRYDLESDRAQNYLKQYELWKRQKAAREAAAQKTPTTAAQQQGFENVPFDPRIIADGPGSRIPFTGQPPATAQNQRLAPWLEGYDFLNPNKTLEERRAEIQRLEREYKAANPNWEQELRTMADDTPIPYMPQQQQGGAVTDEQVQLPQQAAPTPFAPLPQQYVPQQQLPEGGTIGDISASMVTQPGLPTGTTIVPQGIQMEPGQELPATTGQVSGAVAVPTALTPTTLATAAQETQANLMQAQQAAPAVEAALASTQAAQGTVDPRAEVIAAQQTASSVGNVTAAQGEAILIDNPVQRQIQDGELISGVANAETAAAFTEQVQAATATPSTQATVQGQLAQLTANFDAKNPPAWAAGALRNATAAMAQRGLGASSLAGQAIVQATLESALPIAQADASIIASFEQQNLTNRQQRAMLAAQQRAEFMGMEFTQDFQARVQNAARISDIANQNFTAEQQVQLENSRIANTVNLNNLSNKQALTMAEAAALAQMDTQNLNNRQQAAVQNAQSFLQMDMTNLSNQQQAEMFNAQSRIQSLLTDQAATNAAAQFNASSQNQVDQFFANLNTQTSQFNATQANAQSQFNAGQVNVIERFNAELNNQRDQFNAQNRLIIDQSNAQWRRQVSTADTAAINRANEINATALLGLSTQAYNNLWQYYGDSMEWAWTSAENERSRVINLAIEQLRADSSTNIQAMKEDYASSSAFGSLIGTFLTASSSSLIGKALGF